MNRLMEQVADPPFGLREEEARKRLERDGWNEPGSSAAPPVVRMLIDIVREPLFLMLIASGVIYLFLGSIEDAMMLLAFVLVIIAITLVQESRTERSLEALKELSSPRANVIRDGVQKRIPGREVVQGDIILFAEGDRVPADAILQESSSLEVDESILTGEPFPVRKSAGEDDDRNGSGVASRSAVYSGTLVVRGRGLAEVVRTGSRTEIGRIGNVLGSLRPEAGLLQQETRRMVRMISLYSILLCIVVAVVYAMTRHDWLNGLLAGLTLAMATLPEEFPLVLFMFLALGAWRIARERVLTRRVHAIEMLGAATVLCVDKTGTLTMNRMQVKKLSADSCIHDVDERDVSLPEALHEVLEYSILASPPDPFDPMELAMARLGDQVLAKTEHLHHDWVLEKEYPLSEQLLAMSHVWRSRSGSAYVIAAKGAPEAIADLCHLDEAAWRAMQQTIDAIASEGMRVIGVAKASFIPSGLPEEVHDYDFSFVGLLGLDDPVRQGVPEALLECKAAGMRMIMMTGDYAVTARHIGRQIGLGDDAGIITGAELDMMSDEVLLSRIGNTSIFARVQPGQKLRIVEALKAKGEIVAMTGDGVNDAPALKAAHIGIAMGARGTDVAREAASMVLVDDRFESIIMAVRMGRRIYDNIRKAMAFIIAVHLPIAGMSLIPVLLQWPLALLPAHILFLQLVIDPTCSIVFEMEPEEPGLMKRSPRGIDEALLGRRMLFRCITQGSVVLVTVALAYGYLFSAGFSEGDARMIAFAGIVSGNIGLVFSNRSPGMASFRRFRMTNRSLWWVVGGTVLLFVTTISVPLFRELFRFDPFHLHDAMPVVLLSLACFLMPSIVDFRQS